MFNPFKTLKSPNEIPAVAGLEPSFDMNDQELLSLSQQFLGESQPFHDALLKVQKNNEQYYLGNQTKKNSIPTHKCNAVQNQIFMGVETIVPVMTSNAAQFVATPAQETDESQELANSLQEILKLQYDARRVKKHLEQAARHMIIYRLGIIKVFWDEYIDDWNLRTVRPQRIWIPKYGSNVDELPYVLEKIDMTNEEIREFFGEEAFKKVKQTAKGAEMLPGEEERTAYANIHTVWEIWTNDFVFWRCETTILKKQKNPYFDWTGRKEKNKDEFGNDVEKDVFYNHFRRPRKPYVFISPFKLGTSVVGETSLIEQGVPLQDIINTLGRSIVNNAKKMGNSAWFVDAEVMEEEKAKSAITNEEGLIIYGTGVANPNLMRREAPPPLPAYIPNTKIQAENAFDNIFGTHATTRGERKQPETLGGRIMLKQADISRIDLLVREVDRAVSEIGNWAVQMMKMFYESEKTIKIYGENGLKFIQFSRDNIEDGIEVAVKEGSTLQVDELSRRNEAVQLFQIGALDPITLYERLKFSNPEEAAERLVRWLTGQLTPGQQGAAAQGTTPGGQGGQGASGTPPSGQSLKESIYKQNTQ